jgi:hypothetical protein
MKDNKLGIMPISKLIWNMSLPIIVSMLVQALYNIVDSVFVSQVSEQALTAVTLAFPAQNLMIGLATVWTKSEVFESSWDSPLNIVYLNSWTPENHSDVPGIGEYASTSLGSECRTATNCLYDADFLKIRNITIGYDLPEHLTEKVGISKISLRFQINDPKALWIKNNAGIDPETLGIRKQASYMFGVNLSL